MAERNLTYEDLVQIVELIRTTSQFSEFRLKVGDIEVSLKRANGAARPASPLQGITEVEPATPIPSHRWRGPGTRPPGPRPTPTSA